MNPQEFTAILESLQSHQDLGDAAMQNVIAWFLSGEANESQVKEFLVELARKGESIAELAGAARALRASMVRVPSSHEKIVDTCGTGGDGSKTFNISTAAALVVAGAGVPVAKHGNRKVTSSTGSADVLSELGINLEASPTTVEKCLDEAKICFCFAPSFHPAMRHVGPVRRQIPHPTIFNRLGPLSNPASAQYQVLGVGDGKLQDVMAAALNRLGTGCSVVVRGEDGVDEISLSAPTRVLRIEDGEIEEETWCPEDFGIATQGREGLFAEDPESSAACIREVISGAPGPKRDVVVLNAAAALKLVHPELALKECASMAQEAMDSGATQAVLEKLGQLTQQDPVAG